MSKRQQNAQKQHRHTHIKCPKSTSCDDKPMIKTVKRVNKQTIQNGREKKEKKRNGQAVALLHLPRRMFTLFYLVQLFFLLSVSMVMFFALTLHEATNEYVLQVHTQHTYGVKRPDWHGLSMLDSGQGFAKSVKRAQFAWGNINKMHNQYGKKCQPFDFLYFFRRLSFYSMWILIGRNRQQLLALLL